MMSKIHINESPMKVFVINSCPNILYTRYTIIIGFKLRSLFIRNNFIYYRLERKAMNKSGAIS